MTTTATPRTIAKISSTKIQIFLLCTVLTVCYLISYWPSLNGGFLWDDDKYISHNPFILNQHTGWWEILTVKQKLLNYWPVTYLAFWWQYHFWQDNSLGYHLVNVFLHGLNALGLWSILKKLGLPSAAWVAALFLLHPLQMESVAWISELKNVLSAALLLLSLHQFIKYRETAKTFTFWTSWLLFGLAMLAKSSVYFAPFVLWAYVYWRDQNIHWPRQKQGLAFFGLSGFLLLLFWIGERQAQDSGQFTSGLSMLDRLYVAVQSWWFYPMKLFWPMPVMTIYPRWQLSGSQTSYIFEIIALMMIGVGGIIIWLKWRKPILLVFALYTVAIFPLLGWVDHLMMKVTFVSDHYAYLPSIFIFVFICESGLWLLGKITPYLPKIVMKKSQIPFSFAQIGISTLFFLILLWYTGLNHQNATRYTSPENLWRQADLDNPDSFFVKSNLASVLLRKGDLAAAENLLNRAIELNANYAENYVYRAVVNYQQNNFAIAWQDLERALTLRPKFQEALRWQGLILQAKQEYQAAAIVFDKILQNDPNSAEGYYHRGVIWQEMLQEEQALQDYAQALTINPRYAEAYLNRGAILQKRGELDKASGNYNMALFYKPDFIAARLNLAQIRQQRSLLETALADYTTILELQPNHTLALLNRGVTLIQLHRWSEADNDFKRLLKIQPESAEAWLNLGIVAENQKEFNLAVEHYNRALKLKPQQAILYERRGKSLWQISERKNVACADLKKACDLGRCDALKELQKSFDCM